MNKRVLIMISSSVNAVGFFVYGSTMSKIEYHGLESDK